jgi:long-chain acyl-CoA synthetase
VIANKSLDQFARFNNLLDLFFARADELGDAPFLWAKRGGAWTPMNWRTRSRTWGCSAATG